MKLARRVQRMQKVVLGVVVALLSVSLVFWGNFSSSNRSKEGTAGVIFGDIAISHQEFDGVFDVSVPMIWLERYNQYNFGGSKWQSLGLVVPYAMQGRIRFEELTQEVRNKYSWKYVIALFDADQKKVHVGNEELMMNIKLIYQACIGGRTGQEMPFDQDTYRYLCNKAFGAETVVFEQALRNHMRIEKVVRLIGESEFPSYEVAFNEYLNNNRQAKVRYVAFKPDDYIGELKPATLAEIETYYKNNPKKFEEPEKVVVEYLMAEYEQLKSQAKDPTDEEMRKFYNEHQHLYEIKEEKKDADAGAAPHPEHGDEAKKDEKGEEEKKEPKYKPFDEVKDDVKDKLKLERAEDLAIDLMEKVYSDLSERMKGLKENETLDLRPTAEKFKLKHDTIVVSADRIPDAEKIVGNNSMIHEACFQVLAENGIVDPFVKTTKGTLAYRLNKKLPVKVKPLAMDDVQEAIRKELRKEQMKTIARRKASDLSIEINLRGFDRAVVERGMEFTVSDYFEQGKSTGVVRPFEGTAFAMQIGKAATADAGDVSYTIYLEDMIPPSFDKAKKGFLDVWNSKLYASQSSRQVYQQYMDSLQKKAQLVDHVSEKAGGENKGEERKAQPGPGGKGGR